MKQLVHIYFICKTKCKEPVTRLGVNIVKSIVFIMYSCLLKVTLEVNK